MKNRLAGSVLAVGLFAGCAEAPTPANNDPMHDEVLSTMVDYWQDFKLHGINELAGVKLETVHNGQETDCHVWDRREWDGKKIRSKAKSPASYCQLENKVVIAYDTYRNYADAISSKGENVKAWGAVVVAHEMGHAVQDVIGSLEPSKDHELWADCIAGQQIAATYPELLEDAKVIYGIALGSDPQGHGTVVERLNSFTTGAQGVYGCGNLPVKP